MCPLSGFTSCNILSYLFSHSYSPASHHICVCIYVHIRMLYVCIGGCIFLFTHSQSGFPGNMLFLFHDHNTRIISRECSVDTTLFSNPQSVFVFLKLTWKSRCETQRMNVHHSLIRPLVHLVTFSLESFFKAQLEQDSPASLCSFSPRWQKYFLCWAALCATTVIALRNAELPTTDTACLHAGLSASLASQGPLS